MKKRDLFTEETALTAARGWIKWGRATELETEASPPPRGTVSPTALV